MAENKATIKVGLEGDQQVVAGLRRISSQASDLASSIKSAIGSFGATLAGVLSVREFFQAADGVTRLNNALRLATGSASEASLAYSSLFAIAQRSRVGFLELGDTYARIARATDQLGLSQQELLSITETIGNAITVSGASAGAAQAALLQLGQGLASGALRGEELNSVLEQTPRLARALADGLGVSIGKLRELGKEGKLTAEAVIGALQSQQSVLAAEVQNSVLTVGQALTQLQNAATVLVGDIDRATGSSNILAQATQQIAQALGDVSYALRDVNAEGQKFTAFGDAVRVVFETISVLGANVAYVFKAVGAEIGGIAAQAAAILRGEFALAGEIRRQMVADSEAARRDIDRLSDRLLNAKALREQAEAALRGAAGTEDDVLTRRATQTAAALRRVEQAAVVTAVATKKAARAVPRRDLQARARRGRGRAEGVRRGDQADDGGAGEGAGRPA